MPTTLHLYALLAVLSFASNACQKQCPPEFVRDGDYCRVKDDTDLDGAVASGIAPPIWHCEGDANSCTCIQAETATDTCPAPKPTCCFVLEGSPEMCLCSAQDSQPCRSMPTGAMRVSTCPPPS